MKSFFNNIRYAKNERSIWKQILVTIWILILGIALGAFSKYLDFHQSELPYLLGVLDEQLDFHDFLGRFAPWILIAVCISIYSKTPVRAAVNVFMFFVGMVSSYYLYSKYIAGFFPKSYAMIWIGFTAISPLLAFLCWYAKGKGKAAFVISAGIIAILFNMTFAYGVGYFDIKSSLELIVLVIGIIVLHRTIKETFLITAMGIAMAVVLNLVMPFQFC